MEISELKAIIEAMLFAAGREVNKKEIIDILEISEDTLEKLIVNMQTEFKEQNRGVEIIKINDGYQMCSRKEFCEYIYSLFDNRTKPNLSNQALETLSIIAYNPRITRAEIETIRGVNSDGTIYKLLEYGLIEESGKSDAPGRPITFSVTTYFLKTFGMSSLEELPNLPKYKLDENEQIVIDEVMCDTNDTEGEANVEI
ncbi:MAG: SMC-Scp complex subunit ScpB [Oscillospiraceae bacterium]|nr:SMC-Scp complex subunit ScpB [Oscillospiraceae bacterium]